jgi:hypothetical protein
MNDYVVSGDAAQMDATKSFKKRFGDDKGDRIVIDLDLLILSYDYE